MRLYLRALKITSLVIVIFTAVLLLCGTGLFVYAKYNINTEADEILFELAKQGNVTEFYANGAPLGSDYYIPVKIDSTSHVDSKKVWYPISEISDIVKAGFIAVEDHEFYEHDGVNYRRTFAAFLNALFKFNDRFGASTITQQTIKNISGDNEVTFKRKLNEILRAIIIEKNHTKEEILELYLNIVPMGESSIGVGLASEIYFDKLPSELAAEEAALLIGLANAPTKYNPYINPDSAIEKRNKVLKTMLEHEIISKEEYEQGINKGLEISDRANHRNAVNSWFIETASRDIISDMQTKYNISYETAKKILTGGGLTVYTTESILVQDALEKYLENTENLPAEIQTGLEYGAVIIDSVNGNLLGIIGQAGKKEGEWLLNHATAPHTPASTLKPLALYAPLIEKGIINWSSVFDDSPVMYKEINGELVEYPHNSPNKYEGMINIKHAVTTSKNTIAVRLCNLMGPDEVFKSLKQRFDFTTLVSGISDANGKFYTDKELAPLALGQLTNGLPLRELTAAYTVFPGNGSLSKNRSYVKVIGKDNNILLENKPIKKEIFSRSTAEIMNQLLSCVVDEGTAKSITLNELVDTAGKTGTSALNRDKLFVGYTPYITFGIWSGYEDGTTSLTNTDTKHFQLWDSIAREIHVDLLSDIAEGHIKHFKKDLLVYLPYCKYSGAAYSEACELAQYTEGAEYGYFTYDNLPPKVCYVHDLSNGEEKSELFPWDMYPDMMPPDEVYTEKHGLAFHKKRRM